MKTVEEYMNDPRIRNDPCMAGALEPIVRIHAIRLRIEDQYAGMSPEEEVRARNEKGKAALARQGLSDRLVNLSGQGKIQAVAGK
ncbi:hypothetical protein AGMMS49587_16000 [Spirochaetia bacterium]|nr:hypothetical protein AGMMS49587_16000 [Spirochaetia bacterium]